MKKFIKGMDLSTLLENEKCGAKYYVDGKETDILDVCKMNGVDTIRLRLWNDPKSEDGKPYGAGNNDLAVTVETGKRITAAGLGVLLNFHYSDFWADPGKQIKPKAWKNYREMDIESAIYSYTRESLRTLLDAGVNITMIQVGNELSNGLCWPEGCLWDKEHGEIDNYKNVARFVSAGIKACRELAHSVPIMIHLDNGGNNALYRRWFDHYFENGGLDFDYIGMSYYPFWHGRLNALSENMNDIALRYHKDIIIAEVSMGFTMEDYASYEQLKPEERKGYATRESLIAGLDYPMTVQGQMDFTADFLNRVKNVPEERGCGFFWWEPAWIPRPGSGWATPASLEYMKDPGPCGNEWANQALFDYDGNALPTWDIIKNFEK